MQSPDDSSPTTGLSDDERRARELLRQARGGDAGARRRLIESTYPRLRAWLEGRLGGQLKRFTSPDDVLQEVFGELDTILAQLREDATLEDLRKLLFLRVRWRIGKDWRKGNGFEGESVAPSAQFHRFVTSSTGPVTQRDEQRHLQERIRELDPSLREVVRLRLQELTFTDIGQRLEIGEDAARKRFLRACLMLRARW